MKVSELIELLKALPQEETIGIYYEFGNQGEGEVMSVLGVDRDCDGNFIEAGQL